MPSKTSTNEQQYQMTDEFYDLIIQYLKDNNTTLEELCKKMRVEYYLIYKIMDRKIKMHSFLSLLKQIAFYCNISSNIKLGKPQPTKTGHPIIVSIQRGKKKRTTN